MNLKSNINKKAFEKYRLLRVYICFAILGLNISCAQSVESLLDGNWALEKIYYKGEDIFEEKVFTNMMFFNNDSSAFFPRIGERLSKKDLEGNWYYNDQSKQLEFKTKNKYLNGVFDVCFKWHEEKGYLVMVLTSEDAYVEIGKVLSPSELTILPIDCDITN